MRKFLLLFLLVLTATQFKTLAQEMDVRVNIPGLDLPGLIITEVRPDAEATAYVELTNIGDTAINLDKFILQSVYFNTRVEGISDSIWAFNRRNSAVDETIGKVYLKGVVQPGESFVIASAWDANDARGYGIPTHNTAIAEIGNQFVHKLEEFNTNGWIDKPEWQCFGKDSVYGDKVELLRAVSSAGYMLMWLYEKDGVADSTYIDQFNVFHFPEETASQKGNQIFPIAGIDDAMTTSVMVRKSDVVKGNLDWFQSKGDNALSSEWLVIPKNWSRQAAFTTVGVHGDFDLDYVAKDPQKVIVDETAKTISIPWITVRGDSLAGQFNLGQGMSWSYDLNESFEDSSAYIARTGDKFSFYAVGNEVKHVDFTLQVREPEADVALVFPKRRLIVDEEYVTNELGEVIDTLYTRYWSNGFVYGVTQGFEVDSIINVPFATRTDSLLKYLEKPEKATLEFVFADGKERVDLMLGDKVKVTAEDGTTVKEYVVAVNEHIKGNNALLRTVTWPDVNPISYPRWNIGDTLPEFTPLKTYYQIVLNSDEKKIPALQFKTQDLRARIQVENAEDIDGNREQRTTSVTVYSESDTTILTYNFEFIKQGVPVQPKIAEPFISEMVWNVGTQGCAVELFNPGTQELDLSQYMYVAGATSQTWQEAVETCVAANAGAYSNPAAGQGLKIYQTHYVPSMRWAADATVEDWSAVPDSVNLYVGRGFLKDDEKTDPFVAGNDVWIMGIAMNSGNADHRKIFEESDFLFRGYNGTESQFAWDSTLLLQRETPIWNDPRHNMWLLKILNDSIIDGTKDVRDASAYQLIDRFEVIGDTIAGRVCKGKNWVLVRKPNITKGTLERTGGASSTPETSEWILRKGTDGGGAMTANLGIHDITPLTNYLSTVTSTKFIVTPGYLGDNLTITGSIAEYTPTTIAALLDKADNSQVFVFKRDGNELTDAQNLADGDILEVTAGDESAVTTYKLINAPLDNNTSLSAKAGSGLAVTGNKVTGVTLGMTLKDAIDKLEVAEKSILNVLDASGALQPLKMHNLDTLVNDVLVSESLTLQVVAENSDKATYTFDFGLASSDAILLSNIIKIDQNRKKILEYPNNSTAPSILTMVFANEGATIKVFDKAGFERVEGFLNVDDIVEVTAPDGVTKVQYTFGEEWATGIFNVKAIATVNVELFPNPVTYVLNIKGIELSSVNVYTVSGAMMISKSSYSNSVDVSELPSGIYIIQMTDLKGNVVMDKFLKK